MRYAMYEMKSKKIYKESGVQIKLFINCQGNMFGAYDCLLKFLKTIILFCNEIRKVKIMNIINYKMKIKQILSSKIQQLTPHYLSLKNNNATVVKTSCSCHGIYRLYLWSQ